MIEGLDYTYVYPDNDPEFMYIRLLTGIYINTLFKYGKIKIEEKSTDELYFNFEYEVIESTYKKPAKLAKDDKFKEYIGDILLSILSKAIESKILDEQDILDELESGTNNSEESVI
jgi:hypothetical protein